MVLLVEIYTLSKMTGILPLGDIAIGGYSNPLLSACGALSLSLSPNINAEPDVLIWHPIFSFPLITTLGWF